MNLLSNAQQDLIVQCRNSVVANSVFIYFFNA